MTEWFKCSLSFPALLIMCLPFVSYADTWTGHAEYEFSIESHEKEIHAALLKELSSQVSNFLNSLEYRTFIASSNLDSADERKLSTILEAKVANWLAAHEKIDPTLHVNADVHAVPIESGFRITNPNIECPQTLDLESTWDEELTDKALGLTSDLESRLEFNSFQVLNEELVKQGSTNATLSAKPNLVVEATFQISFPVIDGKDFELVSLHSETVDDLATTGQSQVIVALVRDDLHFRIFDRNGEMVIDKAEREIEPSIALRSLRQLFGQNGVQAKSEYHDIFRQRAIAVSSDQIAKISAEARALPKGTFQIVVSEDG